MIDYRQLATPAEAEDAAGRIYQEWARFEPTQTWATCLGDVVKSLNREVQVPRYFGAFEQGTLIGIASLVTSDLPTRRELGPWLANVLVQPALRSKGIGSALVTRVTDYAAGIFDRIYLYTFDQTRLYEHLGWSTIESSRYVDRPITIMTRDLKALPARASTVATP